MVSERGGEQKVYTYWGEKKKKKILETHFMVSERGGEQKVYTYWGEKKEKENFGNAFY